MRTTQQPCDKRYGHTPSISYKTQHNQHRRAIRSHIFHENHEKLAQFLLANAV